MIHKQDKNNLKNIFKNNSDKNPHLPLEVLEFLIENSDALTILTNKDNIVSYISPQVDMVLSLPASRILGKTFPDIIHPDDIRLCQEKWKSVTVNHQSLEDFQYRILDQEGKIRWISHSAKAIIIEDEYIGMQSTIRNITEKKESEILLKNTQEFNKSVLNMSPEIIYVYDIQEAKSIYTNSSIENILGYSANEMKEMGSSMIKVLMHPDDFHQYQEKTLQKYQNLTDNEIIVHEYRMRCKSGQWKWLCSREKVFQRTAQGTVKQIFGIIKDISLDKELKKQQEKHQLALKKSEKKYRLLFENMSNAFALHEIILDENSKPVDYIFLEINEAFEAMTGLKEREIISRKVTEVLPGIEKDPANWIGEYGKVALGEGNLQFEQYSETLKKWYSVNAYSPQKYQFVVMFTDITRIKENELQLRQSEKLQAIGQLAGGVAHDFNNQLSGMMGYLDLLEDQPELAKKSLSYIDKLQTLCSRSADLVKQLLAFARKGHYLSIPVDVHKTLEEVFSLLSHSIDKKIKLIMDFNAKSPICLGDPAQIQNTFLNIALNAKDSMPQGGNLIFSTRNCQLKPELTKNSGFEIEEGNYIHVEIKDTGCGIEEQDLKKIFDPFYTTKEPGKGTGMGLAAAQGIVKNHKGMLRVKSKVKEGSQFSIYLPVSSAQIQKTKKKQKVKPGNQKKILIIDDEPLISEMLHDLLVSMDYQVDSFLVFFDALDIFKQKHNDYDLIILDMMMPGISGSQAFQKLRVINPQIKILIASGFALNNDIRDLLALGNAQFIQKPYRKKNLSKQMEQMLKDG